MTHMSHKIEFLKNEKPIMTHTYFRLLRLLRNIKIITLSLRNSLNDSYES